jgi:hypothetical protein
VVLLVILAAVAAFVWLFVSSHMTAWGFDHIPRHMPGFARARSAAAAVSGPSGTSFPTTDLDSFRRPPLPSDVLRCAQSERLWAWGCRQGR